MTEESVFLSVVVPAYNEERRIGKTLAAMRQFLDKQQYTYEVLVVDDGSCDTTLAVISLIAEGWPNLRSISHSVNKGKGAAVRTGVLAARGQYILFSDADNSTPIDQIDKLLPFIGQYPVVIGSRHCPGAHVHIPQSGPRILLSRASNLLIRILAVPGVYDTQCGFKLFEQRAGKNIFANVKLERWGFDFEMLAIARHLGYPFKEVGIDWYNDTASRVRAGREALRTLRDLFWVKLNLMRGVYSASSVMISHHERINR